MSANPYLPHFPHEFIGEKKCTGCQEEKTECLWKDLDRSCEECESKDRLCRFSRAVKGPREAFKSDHVEYVIQELDHDLDSEPAHLKRRRLTDRSLSTTVPTSVPTQPALGAADFDLSQRRIHPTETRVKLSASTKVQAATGTSRARQGAGTSRHPSQRNEPLGQLKILEVRDENGDHWYCCKDSDCGYKDQKKKNTRRHESRQHGPEIPCHRCGKVFGRSDRLKSHQSLYCKKRPQADQAETLAPSSIYPATVDSSSNLKSQASSGSAHVSTSVRELRRDEGTSDIRSLGSASHPRTETPRTSTTLGHDQFLMKTGMLQGGGNADRAGLSLHDPRISMSASPDYFKRYFEPQWDPGNIEEAFSGLDSLSWDLNMESPDDNQANRGRTRNEHFARS